MSKSQPPVLIDKKLVDRIGKRPDFYARSYAIGKNENGVVVGAVRMKKTGGCHYMPSTSALETSRAVMQLYKKGLIPCGFARVRGELSKDDCYGAQELRDKGNSFCIVMSNKGIVAVKYYTTGGSPVYRDWKVFQYSKGGEKKNGKKHQR